MIESQNGATILGSGDVSEGTLLKALGLAPCLVCADGGANTALKYDQKPSVIIGDMDSISDSSQEYFNSVQVIEIKEQYSTDFDKCIRTVNAPTYIAVGVFLPQMDHGLASLNLLARYKTKRIVLLTETDCCFLAPPKLDIKLPIGTRFSLFPLSVVVGKSKGLKWSIDGLNFNPLGQIGTSNKTVEREVSLQFFDPAMIVVLPSDCTNDALTSLTQAPQWNES